MDEVVKQSIQLVQSKQRNDVPWKMDEPCDQLFYAWSNTEQRWDPVKTPKSSSEPAGEKTLPTQASNKLALYSWNIDFMLPFPDSRMRAAVRHLQSLIDPSIPTVIFVAECLTSDLTLLASDPWVRSHFHLTDLDGTYWQSGHYGTTMLIDVRLPIARCFRVHYSESRMERDACFADLNITPEGETLRLCNTHLESLALQPAYRPPQLQICAKYMHAEGVAGAVLAGDLNAIEDFDRHLHTDNDLRDAYLELDGDEESAEKGHTWGQQAATVQRERFGTCRMDKVLFCGGVECEAFRRFGEGVEVADEKEREAIVKLGFDRPWITDHLGVHALFNVR